MTKKLILMVLIFIAALAVIPAAFFLAMLLMMPNVPEEETPLGFPTGPISEFGASEIPAEYIPIYQAAAKKYGVPWNLLAAVHRVETVFSTIGTMESYAGAIGHMQFMPCTWTGWSHPSCSGLGAGRIDRGIMVNPKAIAQYGGLGIDANGDGIADPFDLEDAIHSAAKYLADNGAANGQVDKAIFTYNHSMQYVSDVKGFMEKYVLYEPISLMPGTGGFNRPLNTNVNSPFEMRFHPIDKEWRLHGGIDFACTVGQPVPASKAGIVTYSGWMDASRPTSGYGIYVWVDHGGGYKTTYAHLSAASVAVGTQVKAGDIVGGCGSTGKSSGPHLHFEIFKNNKLVDPAPFLGL